jgi:hypothetical protein
MPALPEILPPELDPWLWVWACMLLPPPALWPFSAAQEGVAAAKAIAPTTPSMSGSFITALFMIAPPVLAPKRGMVASIKLGRYK